MEHVEVLRYTELVDLVLEGETLLAYWHETGSTVELAWRENGRWEWTEAGELLPTETRRAAEYLADYILRRDAAEQEAR